MPQRCLLRTWFGVDLRHIDHLRTHVVEATFAKCRLRAQKLVIGDAVAHNEAIGERERVQGVVEALRNAVQDEAVFPLKERDQKQNET